MIRYVRGWLLLRVSGASPESCLNRFSDAGIAFWSVEKEDELHLLCRVYMADREKAERAALRAMCTLDCLRQAGLPLLLSALKKRPLLPIGVLLAVTLALLAQEFVWVVRIEGNDRVSEAAIRHALIEEGVGFGTWGQDIDSPRLRMRMQNRLPALRWLAANRNGAVLTVLVSERPNVVAQEEPKSPANVVASRAGLIQSISVLRGTAAVEVGDAVLTGELLISGVTSWEKGTQITRAAGEVYALTDRQITASIPATYEKKSYTGERTCELTLIFGRNRRKIFGNSRIFHTSCDKMIKEEVCRLPGGDALPLTLEWTVTQPYRAETVELTQTEAEAILTAFALRQAQAQMIAGRILQTDLCVTKENGCYVLRGDISCEEMISRTAPIGSLGEDEEIGKTDQRGTD